MRCKPHERDGTTHTPPGIRVTRHTDTSFSEIFDAVPGPSAPNASEIFQVTKSRDPQGVPALEAFRQRRLNADRSQRGPANKLPNNKGENDTNAARHRCGPPFEPKNKLWSQSKTQGLPCPTRFLMLEYFIDSERICQGFFRDPPAGPPGRREAAPRAARRRRSPARSSQGR